MMQDMPASFDAFSREVSDLSLHAANEALQRMAAIADCASTPQAKVAIIGGAVNLLVERCVKASRSTGTAGATARLYMATIRKAAEGA